MNRLSGSACAAVVLFFAASAAAGADAYTDVAAVQHAFSLVRSVRMIEHASDGKSMTIDYVAPNRYRFTAGSDQLILIGSVAYVRRNGAWSRQANAAQLQALLHYLQALSGGFNLRRFFVVKNLGMKRFAGRAARAYQLASRHTPYVDVVYVDGRNLPIAQQESMGVYALSVRYLLYNAPLKIAAPAVSVAAARRLRITPLAARTATGSELLLTLGRLCSRSNSKRLSRSSPTLTLETMMYRYGTVIGSFLPFHKIIAVFAAGPDGFTSFIESRLFGLLISKKTLLRRTRWNQLSRIELSGVGNATSLIAFPKDEQLFNAPIWTITGQKHWKTGARGSVIMIRGLRAVQAYEYFSQYVPASKSFEEHATDESNAKTSTG